MLNKKKLALIGISLAAVISCTTTSPKTDINNKNSVYNNENEKEVNVTFKSSSKNYMNRFTSGNSDYTNPLYIYTLTENDFYYEGPSYFYENEEIILNQELPDDIILEKVYAKHPVAVIKKDNEKYGLFENNEDYKVTVDSQTEAKTVEFLKENYVYVSLKDKKTGNVNEVRLNKKVNVIKDTSYLAKGTRYKDLEKGVDNNRIKYEVISYKDGYEDETAKNNEGVEISWDNYYKYDKYEDLDDLAGVKRVEVRKIVGDKEVSREYKDIDFGLRVQDFAKDYSEILTDLDKTTLKFSNDGNQIEGGFNLDLVKKLKTYEEKIGNDPNKLEFVTEILDNDKKSIGNHNIVRKIVRNGVVLYEKKEYAHIGFPGTTVVVADSSFYDISPEVEKRMIRYIPKKYDATEDDRYDPLNLDRPHGSYVIGSMIDELSLGNSAFLNNLINLYSVKMILTNGYIRKFSPNTGTTDDEIMKNAKLYLSFLSNQNKYMDVEFYYNLYKKLYDRIGEYETKEKEKIASISDKTEKEAYIKNYYKELFGMLEDLITTPEDLKLQNTDIHFKTIAIDDGDGLKSSRVKRYLPRILEEDHNVKAVNMSYGSEFTVEEYKALKNMSYEDKLRAVNEYNNNVAFRLAIRAWLHQYDYGSLDAYEERLPGSLSIPEMGIYFDNRDKITVEDYEKLINTRLLLLKTYLGSEEEIANTNKDVLFVVAQGNTYHNSSQVDVNLTDFDEYGRKVIYKDPNAKRNNTFISLPSILNEFEKEKAEKEGKEYNYNYNYRKNMLGVVGLANKKLPTVEKAATDNISDDWSISTSDLAVYNKLGIAQKDLDVVYAQLVKDLDKALKNKSVYRQEYIDSLLAKINSIEELRYMDTDYNDKPFKFAFTRAGDAKLWVVAAEGYYDYTKKLSEDELKYVDELTKYDSYDGIFNKVKPFIGGSSFAAPRITAIAGKIGTLYPWMTAQQIKQTILTTATDDFRVITIKDKDEKQIKKVVGIYGVDENIGWGISNKYMAFRGPARFVRALTMETNNEDFVANIPYGTYEFKNDIEGKFDVYLKMYSEGKLSKSEFTVLESIKDYNLDYVLSKDFDTNEETKAIVNYLKENNIAKTDIYLKFVPKVENYLNSLSVEDRDLYKDAGLVKKGKGTLILSGNNTYEDPTVVEEGTLVVRGSSKSPFVVHKDAKLKLDMSYLETLRNSLLDDGEEEFVSKINADVYNFGSLYSYSKSDKILKTYTPNKDSKTLIAATARLFIENLNLNEVKTFKFDIFRKKGMEVFKKPNFIDEDDSINKADMEKDVVKNYDESEVLRVARVNKDDLYKVKVGTFEYTPYIDLVVETKEIDGDSEHVSLIAKLVRKLKVEKENNKVTDDSNGAAVRSSLLSMLEAASGEEYERLNQLLETIDFMDVEERNKAFDGSVLADAMFVGYDILDVKNSLLKEKLIDKGHDNKFNFFNENIISNKFKLEKDNRNVLTLGTMLGMYYNTKYNSTGVSFNMSHSTLFEYTIPLQAYKYNKTNDMTEEEIEKEEAKKQVRSLKGNVYVNNYGGSIFNKFSYNNGYLTGILNFDYLSKKTERKINDRETLKSDSADFIVDLNLEGGYTFTIQNRYKLTPYLGLDVLNYTKGSFNEIVVPTIELDNDGDYEFNFASKNENTLSSKLNVGTRVDIDITKNMTLGFDISYTKYLTDPTLKTKLLLDNYHFDVEQKGLTLEDNYVKYGLDFIYKHNDRLQFNVGYKGKNLRTHTFNTGIKFEF